MVTRIKLTTSFSPDQNCPGRSPESVDAAKRQTAANLPLYGKPVGYELASEKTFGKSFALFTS